MRGTLWNSPELKISSSLVGQGRGGQDFSPWLSLYFDTGIRRCQQAGQAVGRRAQSKGFDTKRGTGAGVERAVS